MFVQGYKSAIQAQVLHYLKKTVRTLLYLFFLAGTVLVVMEIAYRYQWIDFYATEWRALNPASQPVRPRKKILVLGDSFSAQPFSYVQVLRDSLPDCAVYNAAVSGTGIQEACAIARNRLRRIEPDMLLYQVYVGNDLWELHKHISGRVSWLRRVYWWVADRSLFIRYLNYKSGQLKAVHGSPAPELKDTGLPYDPETYSSREKMLLRADPRVIEHSVLLTGGRKADMAEWQDHLQDLIRLADPAKCKIVILPVPHCAQVSPLWRLRMQDLGAAELPAETARTDYPFLRSIQEFVTANPNVQVLSPLPVFQSATAAGSRLYYENDPHLSPDGHQLLGSVVLKKTDR